MCEGNVLPGTETCAKAQKGKKIKPVENSYKSGGNPEGNMVHSCVFAREKATGK